MTAALWVASRMKIRKAIPLSLLCIVLLLLLCSCLPRFFLTLPEETVEEPDIELEAEPVPEPEPVEPSYITISHGEGEETSLHQALLLMQEKLLQESGGRLQLEIYPNAQLGNDQEQLAMLVRGGVNLLLMPTASLAELDEGWNIFALPFYFSNAEEAMEAAQNGAGRELNARLNDGLPKWADEPEKLKPEDGMASLGFLYGWQWAIANNARPLTTAADFSGLTFAIRPESAKISAALFNALNAGSREMVFWQVQQQIADGKVQGEEDNLLHLWQQKSYEQQQNISILGHRYGIINILAHETWLNNLEAADKELLLTACQQLQEDQHRLATLEQEAIILDMEAAGATVFLADQELQESFRNQVKGLYSRF